MKLDSSNLTQLHVSKIARQDMVKTQQQELVRSVPQINTLIQHQTPVLTVSINYLTVLNVLLLPTHLARFKMFVFDAQTDTR